MQKILQSEKIELYECKAIEVMIEFLYMHYRKVVMVYRLPMYIFQLVIFYTAILLNEYSQMHIGKREEITKDIIAEVIAEEEAGGD